MFKKILIANRGEIAVRVMTACREMGIATVAVYSDADAKSLHVQMADEAVHIGEAAPSLSYLVHDKIIAAAKSTGAQAIHPGYGFLSENEAFAARCKKEKITFIGPSPESIKAMGNKLASRKLAIEHKVPVIPGSKGTVENLAALQKEAKAIGFPVLIKAAAGGGGKGMRVVDREADLAESLEMAASEAQKAFGDDTVFVEKYIRNGRHIEFQVLGDTHGNLVHLFERECSVQRRHQKIIEETPSVALTPKLRAAMGESALRLAKAVNYHSAGTVEFMLDEDGSFYLLEMNTRVQVEHPITEMVTGVDLVKWQIRIAAGETLTLKQDDIRQQGHAIECRVYAEDVEMNFMPSPGTLHVMREPRGPGIRNDTGVYSGFEIGVDYDPMISKLIVHDHDRDAARHRMRAALDDYAVLGPKTTIPFLAEVMEHPAFAKGETYTHFLQTHFPKWKERPADDLAADALLAIALHESTAGGAGSGGGGQRQAQSTPWQTLGAWQIGGVR